MLQRAPPWWYITAQSTSARAGPTVHLARVCGSSASRRQPGGEQLHRALLWRLDSDARYRAQKHVSVHHNKRLPSGVASNRPPERWHRMRRAHKKSVGFHPILAKKERFLCARQEWAPGRRDGRGWRRAVLDMARASEHDTLHHCLQPCCGPRPPLRLSLCAATAAEGKISWRRDDERPKQLFRAAVSVPTARCSGYSHWGRSVKSTACHTQRLLPLPLPLPLHLPLGARDGAGAIPAPAAPCWLCMNR